MLKSPAALICFLAGSSVPCRHMIPILENIVSFYFNRINFGIVDLERHAGLEIGTIQSIPTCILVSRGRELDRLIGIQSEEVLRRLLDVFLT